MKHKPQWALIGLRIANNPEDMWFLTEGEANQLAENKMGIAINKPVEIAECKVLSVFNTKKEAKAAWKQKQYFSEEENVYFIHKLGNRKNPKYYKKWLF